MNKWITVSSLRAVLIFLVMLSLVVAGNIQTAKAADEPLTVEGVWVITSSNYPNKNGGYTIVREGDGYNVIPNNTERGGGKYHGVGLYYGSSTEIKATSIQSLDALVDFNEGSKIPISVLRELAGKVTFRYRFKLSPDGQSMELASDFITISYYPETGRLQGYDIMPYADKATLKRISGPPPTPSNQPLTTAMAQVESRGEFYVLTTDGRKLTGNDANQIPLEKGTKVITGSSGHIRMKLPDETTFTIGPNSDIVIDEFVYDPDSTPKTIVASVLKGVFRWVTGNVKPDPQKMKVKLPVYTIGIRGTDFEATVNPDGSGFVILYFGQLEITEKKTGFTFILDAGHKVTCSSDGSVSRPIKVD